MNDFERLNSDAKKYLRLRKIFRALETSVSLIVIIILLVFDTDYRDIFACVAAILIIPESILAVKRSIIKNGINNHSQNALNYIRFCFSQKNKCEEYREAVINQGNKDSKLYKDISLNIEDLGKRISEASKFIEDLKPLRRLVRY